MYEDSMHHTIDEEQEKCLVNAAKEGDKEAFGKIFDLYYVKILKYFTFHLPSSEEAEDLASQVFIKAWAFLPRLKVQKGKFKAWLFRIAHNLLVDHYRVKKDTVSYEDDLEIESSSKQPEQLLLQTQESTELKMKLRLLDQRSREVLICRFLIDLSHKETANLMKLSEANVRVIQLRALQKLRDLYLE